MNRATCPASDPSLPGLGHALDPTTAARAFAGLIENHQTSSLQCTIERVRHKRGQKAILGYRLDGIDNTGTRFMQHVMARVYPPNVLAGRFREAYDAGPATPRHGPGVAIVPELGAVAWFFPNDRKISALRDLIVDDPIASPALQWLLDTKGWRARDLRTASVEVVRYVPEQGCTVRWQLEFDCGERIVYAKCRSDARGLHSLNIQRLLQAAALVRVPEPLAFDVERNIFWQDSLEGSRLHADEIIAQPQLWWKRIEGALAGLRLAPINDADLEIETPSKLRAHACNKRDEIVKSMPHLAEQLRIAFAALDTRLSAMPETGLVLAHGDLHTSNLLWTDHGLALLDFDTAIATYSARDAASLAAAIVNRAIARGLDDDIIASTIEAARAHSAHGSTVAFDTLFAYALLCERLYRATTRWKHAFDTPSRLLALATQILASASKNGGGA